jgi:hypothetical protein
MGATGSTESFEQENLTQSDYFVNLGVDGRVILKWILKKYNWETYSGFFWISIETVAGGGQLVVTLMLETYTLKRIFQIMKREMSRIKVIYTAMRGEIERERRSLIN